MRYISKIGRGKRMSIAKAALLVHFHGKLTYPDFSNYVYTGDLDNIHWIVEIAGANHCGPATAHQVVGCLGNSPYWKVDGYVRGWSESRAACYMPTAQGLDWLADNYEKYQELVNDLKD